MPPLVAKCPLLGEGNENESQENVSLVQMWTSRLFVGVFSWQGHERHHKSPRSGVKGEGRLVPCARPCTTPSPSLLRVVTAKLNTAGSLWLVRCTVPGGPSYSQPR